MEIPKFRLPLRNPCCQYLQSCKRFTIGPSCSGSNCWQRQWGEGWHKLRALFEFLVEVGLELHFSSTQPWSLCTDSFVGYLLYFNGRDYIEDLTTDNLQWGNERSKNASRLWQPVYNTASPTHVLLWSALGGLWTQRRSNFWALSHKHFRRREYLHQHGFGKCRVEPEPY